MGVILSLNEEKKPVAHATAILIAIVVLALCVRMLWIETPVARDEGVAGYIAMIWSRGLSPYTYPMAAVNPPIAYLIYLVPSQLFGNSVIPERMINDVLFIVSIVILYLIAKEWFNERTALVSAFLYGLFMNAPIFETQLAIPSSLSISFIVGSVYSFSTYLRNGRRVALFASGLLMSVSSLILQYQAVGIILLLVMLIYSKYKASKKSNYLRRFFTRNFWSSFSILAAGIILPVLAVVIYLSFYGAVASFIQATVIRFLGPGYIGEPDVYSSVILLIFLEAAPLWLFSIVGFALCFLEKKGYGIFLIAWTICFLVIALPPAHFGRHFSQLIPQASLLSGVAITLVSKESGARFKSFKKNLRAKSLRNGTDGAETKATAILLMVTMVMTFIPAIYFQSTQYPNTNFSFFNQTQYYTFANNWNEQQEIVQYIDLHARNGSVLIHGWEAELYWMSGSLAPGMRWTSSYLSPVPDITNDEYEKILSSVKASNFDVIILMTGFLPDEIMRVVPEEYFFVKNVGLYAIYGKYDAEGYSTEYNFGSNLPQALQEYSLANGTRGYLKDLFNAQIYLPVIEELTINNDSRIAIKQHPLPVMDSQTAYSNLVFGNISVSQNSKLSLGIGIDPSVWNSTDGVTFKILLQDDAGLHEVFSRFSNPKENVGDRRWQDYLLDMVEFVGKKVSVYFVTDPGPSGNNGFDWAYWSKPLLVESP